MKKERKHKKSSIILGLLVAIVAFILSYPLMDDKIKQWLEISGELQLSQFKLAFVIALFAFLLTALVSYLHLAEQHIPALGVQDEVFAKFLKTYERIHDKRIFERMLSVFEDTCTAYSGIDKHQQSFFEYLLIIKFRYLLEECFTIPSDDKEKVVKNIPGFYFQNDDKSYSVWDFLVSKSENYRSFQVLSKDTVPFYDIKRTDDEIKTNTGRLKLNMKTFKKIIAVEKNIFKDCCIIKDKIDENSINQCFEICTNKANCKISLNVVTHMKKWIDFSKSNKKKSIVKINCIFLEDIKTKFENNKEKDFGIFDNILGIQNKIDATNSPIGDNMRCDFYFDANKIAEYISIFDDVLKKN